jgi:NAD(P)-dependent dehydrogenase (short-subunit alcohol dehydrogenase family)
MVNVAITGAGRGIGLELVKQYADAGDRVFALCRSPDKASDLNALAAASRGQVSVHAMDVGDDASVRVAAASTGHGPIDILLNVAGVVGGEKQGLEDQAWADWQDAFNVMIIGPLRVMQALLPRLGPGARVMNITSQLAASTWPYGGYYAYGAAKAGLNRMMRSVALDVKDRGIVIGLVHPGWVQTDMGGPGAEITTGESASGIRQVTAEWPLEESGDFKKWNGETHAW